MELLVLTIAVAVLSHGVASYENEGYSVHEFGNQDDYMSGGYGGGGGGGGGKKFNPKLEVIHGPHEHIEVKGYSPKLEELGQHVEIPEAPIKVIRVTKTVAIKVPVPYPVKIKEKVPYPVTVHKPYPVPVPQIIKVPHVIPSHTHSAKPHTEHKQEGAPVWPSKEHEQSEYSEYDDETAKVSNDGGYNGGGGSLSYGGVGGIGGVGEGHQQALGGFSHDSGTGGGASFYPQQYNQGHSGASLGDFGGYHSAAAAPSGYGGGGYGGGGSDGEALHYDGAGAGSVGQHGGGGATYNFQPESNSYDAAIQEYLAKLKQQGAGGGHGGSGDSYAGSYGGNSIGFAPSADDYHKVHEVETAKVDTVSYDH